ncbi:MAG: hypothetical protein L6R28_24405 [Planctomycetes bacterium]|nr:hypothetical protein [Planctomycetota bacterium]
MMTRRRLFLAVLLVSSCLGSMRSFAASTAEEFKVKRAETFEFASPPEITREGDRVTVTFESKAACDATVAVQTTEGKIIRHLASGVLGENAPPPFAKTSLKQTLVWDGKDDSGKYVDDADSLEVRVSLGLKPQFERTLFWSPYKRVGFPYPSLASAPEGVYVAESYGVGHVRLFDHDGNYVKAVYPFPAEKVGAVQGLKTHAFAVDGIERPLKTGYLQATLLAAGTGEYDAEEISTIAWGAGGKIAVLQEKLNRIAADGSSGGLPFYGPKVGVDIPRDAGGWGHKECTSAPLSAAFSPDGKTLYLAGYQFDSWRNRSWLGVVYKMDYASDKPPEVFAGKPEPGEHLGGTGNGEFRCATSVDTDAQGRVYVSDYGNNRVQVFGADGKFLKAVAVATPGRVNVHRKTGEIFVFSYLLSNRLIKDGEQVFPCKLFHFGAFDDPKQLGAYDLPMEGYAGKAGWHFRGGIEQRMALDAWGDKPRFWLQNGYAGGVEHSDDGSFRQLVQGWDAAGVQIVELAGKKLKVVKRFVDVAKEDVQRATPPILWRQRLVVNPKTGKLYVAEGDCGVMKAVNQLVEVDPDNGKIKLVELPLGSEDLCFDQDGLIYLRTDQYVSRFDFRTGREVPFDYGEELENHSWGMGARGANLIAALPTPGHRSFNFWQLGGIDINVKGHLAVTTCNGNGMTDAPQWQRGEAHFTYEGGKYVPGLYPGRKRWGEIHIYDRHGQKVVEDALPGIAHLNGIGLDADNNLYLLSASQRLDNGKPFDPKLPRDASGTLLKVPAGKAKVLNAGQQGVPIPLTPESQPKRGLELKGYTTGWVENAEWFYGNVGFSTPGMCICWNTRFDLDYFNRSFAPEPMINAVTVLDASGNVILRTGKYGNVEDGKPLVAEGGPAAPHAIGGDEVALFYACYVAADTDHRLFIADAGNGRILSVKLGYHAEKSVPLKGK